MTGVRIEAAGRLTRRYTAARALYKFRYKGSLQNKDYSLIGDDLKTDLTTVMLRNYVKANSQHSFACSKRRVGAYGIKT